MSEMTYLKAITDGLRSEMRSDERVLLMGEDIGVFGGAFKVTDGLFDEFGADRVMDTPLAESGIIGTAIGAAVVGMRPVCEMQFAINPVERAATYGFPGVSVDGNDVEAMFEATRVARERAISGGGPTLIEAVTMRMHGHGAHDDMKYVPKALVEEWRKKDPIDRQSARVAELGVDVEALRASARSAAEGRRSSRP